MRLSRLPFVLGLACAAVQAPCLAAPPVWELEAPALPQTLVGEATGTVNTSRRPVWDLDAEIPPLPDLATVSPPSAVPSVSQTTLPAASSSSPQAVPPAASQPVEETRRGLPPFGVPIEPPFPQPYIGGALPSAYTGGWGNYWLGLSGGTPGKQRDGVVDGSFNAGIGFGDFYRTLAVELEWGIGSIKNFNFNGGFSASAGRLIIDEPRFQLAAGGGVLSFYTYGNEGEPEPASGYGVITLATPLRPGNFDFAQVLQISLGAGGYQFSRIDPVSFDSDSFGLFAALGVEITRNVGLSLGWSNRGTNVNLSYTPFRGVPVYVNVVGADLFNTSPSGTVAVFSLSWGDDFRTALF